MSTPSETEDQAAEPAARGDDAKSRGGGHALQTSGLQKATEQGTSDSIEYSGKALRRRPGQQSPRA